MFETSVVRDQTAPGRRRVTLLSVSVLAHSAMVFGAVALSVASVEFPATAPNEYRAVPSLIPVQIPPPLGRPDGGAGARGSEASAPKPVERELRTGQETAPAEIPETVPDAEGWADGGTGVMKGGGSGPLGVPWGAEGSIGDIDAPSGGVEQTVGDRIYHAHEVNPPVLMHRVDPPYPAVMMRHRVPATVVVRCVIDRNGRVREPVIVKEALAPFNESVLVAVRQWRFRPGSLNGRAVETYLDLTVTFSVK
jgi:TonB family protein